MPQKARCGSTGIISVVAGSRISRGALVGVNCELCARNFCEGAHGEISTGRPANIVPVEAKGEIMEVPDRYKGREQTYFKHCLLEAYLKRLFMIVGQHASTICYVDCFAGPWEEQGDDLNDTSIAKSLELIKKCRDSLRAMDKLVQFRALYVEQNSRSFHKLENFLTGWKNEGIDIEAFNGSFHELIPDILRWCKPRDFVFFFIDPKGWKNAVELSTLAPLLKRPNSEFLINFMYDFLSRTVSQEKFKDDMQSIFGIIPDEQGKTPVQREEILVSRYRANLKRVLPADGGKPRTASIKVLKPTKDRTLYHLVYLTRHHKGIIEFMDASDKLELVQRRARAAAKQDARIQRSKQTEMFAAAKLVGDKRSEIDPEIEEFWLNRLKFIPERFGLPELADMLEETGWFESDFQKAFSELTRKGLVENLDGTTKRWSKFIHFDNNERLVKVKP